MTLTIKKQKSVFALIILLSTRFFYILPEYFVVNTLCCENIMVLVALLWAFTVCGIRDDTVYYKYKGIVIFGIILILTSSLQASWLYEGQSIIDGLSCQKIFLSGLILYFPLSRLIQKGELTFKDIIDVLFVCSCLHMLVYFVQYLVGPSHVFLSCYYTTPSMDSRVTRIRLYGSCYTITFSLIICAVNAMNRLYDEVGSKKIMNKDLAFVVVANLFNAFIIMGRQMIISYIVIVICALFFAKKRGVTGLVIFAILIVVVGVVMNTGFVQEVISEYQGTTIDTHSTMGVRLRAQEFYANIIREHPILGGGYADTSISSAAIGSGYSSGYYIGDNGIYGFVFRYGLPGLIWAIALMLTFFKNGIRLSNQCEKVVFIKLISLLVGIINSASWFDGLGIFYTILYLIYIESYYMEEKEVEGELNELTTA